MTGPSKNPESLRERLQSVRGRVAAAATRSGRPAEAVTLIAVTKTQPVEAVAGLFALGHLTVGENRVQEALSKIDALRGSGDWHFIGHLQRNKARRVVGRFDLLHSVDSPRLIQELERQARRLELTQPVLLELNLAGDGAKTGAPEAELPRLLEALMTAPHVKATGLMTMAPYDPDPEQARPVFTRLRELLEQWAPGSPLAGRELSMGMSGDFEVGIEEGATLVRVGTAILGDRLPREA